MNRDRFTLLIRHELPGLRRFLLAACAGDAFLADDIAQEALLRAYTASAGFDDEKGFARWLWRITCNCFADHQRRHAVRSNVLPIDQARAVASEQRADASFQYQELHQAIAQLSTPERTAILLFYLQDYPIREIAAIMGVAEGTVKASLSRGREHLREKLKS